MCVELPAGAVIIESCDNCSYSSDEQAIKFAAKHYPRYKVGFLEIKGHNCGEWILFPPKRRASDG